MSSRNLLWWLVYSIIAIWLQKIVPGLDALAPGLIICLQEENKQQTLIYMLFAILIQEGAGSLPFGSSILWYGFVIFCYYVGVWFFMSENLLFILMLSLALAAGKGLFFIGMGTLQYLPLDPNGLLRESLAQAIFTVVLWTLAGRSRAKFIERI